MNTTPEYWQEIVAYLGLGAGFGLLGGLVRVLRRGVRGWLDLLAQIAVSGFCGALVFGLLDGVVPGAALAAIAGVAGNSGGQLLDVLRWRLIRRAAGLDSVPAAPAVEEEPESFTRKSEERD